MDNREHFSAADDSIDLEIAGVKVDVFFDGILVKVGI